MNNTVAHAIVVNSWAHQTISLFDKDEYYHSNMYPKMNSTGYIVSCTCGIIKNVLVCQTRSVDQTVYRSVERA